MFSHSRRTVSEAPAPRTQDQEDRSTAVDADMMAGFLRDARNRRRAFGVTAVAVVLLFWPYVDALHLLGWLACLLGVLALRAWAERRWTAPDALARVEAQRAFVRRMTPLHLVQGALWGSLAHIAAHDLPRLALISLGIFVAAGAAGAVTTASLILPIARRYLAALCITALVLCGFMAFDGPTRVDSPGTLLAIVIAQLHFWALMHWISGTIYRVKREQCELQYDLVHKEQEARAAMALKNRFMATAAHDMRQPVVALALYVEHLRSHPETYQELTPKIAAATKAANDLFDSLFDLASLDSGQVRTHPQALDLHALLREVQEQFEPLAQARGIALRVRCSRTPLRVHSDAVSLRRMLANVLVNAMKYSPSDRRILITARRRGDQAQLDVWDQGFGIPADEIHQVFDEFYRVDRNGTQDIDGLGLGLSIVTRLARLLQAQVKIASVEGLGTRFTIALSALHTPMPPKPA